ncbi:MAG: AarF/ABC1/UbiB kinase family protein [Polyangiales bacterium]
MASLFTAVRDLGRLREIVAVLARHGFGEALRRMGLASLAPASTQLVKDGQRQTEVHWSVRVRLVLQDLGPSFIKLGQIASTRGDLMPAELVTELKKLQDDVPPVAVESIRKELESSLASTIDEVYARFDDVPLATASIGQVHRARLRARFDEPTVDAEGKPLEKQEREVVVKVQRPGVKATIERDLELLHILAGILERSIEEAAIYDPVGLVDQFDRSITAELDFSTEAQNAERFRRNFAGWDNIAFPTVYKAASTKRVLTIEFFDGKKVHAAVAAGFEGKRIAKEAVGIVVKMIFEDGFFHADPHPGNIIILGDAAKPIVGMIDLGMVGRLAPEMRDKTIRLMVAAVRNDPRALADALYAIGRPTKKIVQADFRARVAELSEKYLGRPLKEIELSGLIRDLVGGAIDYGLEVPTDFLMVGKALMTIEGIGKELDPELDVLAEAKPYFIELLQKRLSPQEIGKDLLRGAEQFLGVAHDLPLHIQEVLDDVRLGRLRIQTVETTAAPTYDRFGRRVFSGFVIASLNIAGGLALIAASVAKEWKYPAWLAGLLFFSAWTAWAVHVGKDWFQAWWAKGRKR